MQYKTILDFVAHAKQMSHPVEQLISFIEKELPKSKQEMKWGTLFFSIKVEKKKKNVCYIMIDGSVMKLGFPHGWLMMQEGYFDKTDHAQVRYLTVSAEMLESEEEQQALKSLILEACEV
jgi:hypothetical protein